MTAPAFERFAARAAAISVPPAAQRVFALPAASAGGDRKAEYVVRLMTQMAVQAHIDPEIRRTALAWTAGVDGRDHAAIARAIEAGMRRHIVYTNDPAGAESLDTPRHILAVGRADCDGSVLQAALLLSLGVRVRFVIVGRSAWGPYSHVFVESHDPRMGRWLNGDWVAVGDQKVLVAGFARRRVFDVAPGAVGLGGAVLITARPGEGTAYLHGIGTLPPASLPKPAADRFAAVVRRWLMSSPAALVPAVRRAWWWVTRGTPPHEGVDIDADARTSYSGEPAGIDAAEQFMAVLEFMRGLAVRLNPQRDTVRIQGVLREFAPFVAELDVLREYAAIPLGTRPGRSWWDFVTGDQSQAGAAHVLSALAGGVSPPARRGRLLFAAALVGVVGLVGYAWVRAKGEANGRE